MLISNNSYHDVKVTKVIAPGKSGGSADTQCTLNAIIGLASLSDARRSAIILWNLYNLTRQVRR